MTYCTTVTSDGFSHAVLYSSAEEKKGFNLYFKAFSTALQNSVNIVKKKKKREKMNSLKKSVVCFSFSFLKPSERNPSSLMKPSMIKRIRTAAETVMLARWSISRLACVTHNEKIFKIPNYKINKYKMAQRCKFSVIALQVWSGARVTACVKFLCMFLPWYSCSLQVNWLCKITPMCSVHECVYVWCSIMDWLPIHYKSLHRVQGS